jgi:hypothetical protein
MWNVDQGETSLRSHVLWLVASFGLAAVALKLPACPLDRRAVTAIAWIAIVVSLGPFVLLLIYIAACFLRGGY